MKLHEIIGNTLKSDSSFITLSLDISEEADRDVFYKVLKDDGWVKVKGITTLWQKAAPFGKEIDKSLLSDTIKKAKNKSKAKKVAAVYIVGTKASKLYPNTVN